MKAFMGLILSLAVSLTAMADLMEDFDSLGGNDELLRKAQSIAPQREITIVQKRIVDRVLRHELAPEYTNVLGGDAYLLTQYVGFTYHFHINPKISLGLTYRKAFNKLSSEGEKIINDFEYIPDTDFPNQVALLSARWYPVYGKFSLYDMGVVHFDAYLAGAGGMMYLRSGPTPTFAFGPGVGLWFSQHLSFRTEIMYQNYASERFTGDQSMDITQLNMSLGYLL